MKDTRPKLQELADRISAHLRRFEADQKVNVAHDIGKIQPYFQASARRGGARVLVRYVSFQGWSSLTRADAERYLAWLDAGYVGKHWQALASQQARSPKREE